MALPTITASGSNEVESVVAEIGQAIFKRAKISIETAASAVVPSIPEMVAEITEDLKSGPMNRFAEGLKKLDKLVDNLGGNISDYSKELAGFLRDREEKTIRSEQTITELRKSNIIAEVNKITGTVEILSKAQIEKQENRLEKLNSERETLGERLEKNRKLVQEEGKATKKRKDDIKKTQDKILKNEEERIQILQTLNKEESGREQSFREKTNDFVEKYVPDGLRDIGATFSEGLMQPFTVIKDLGMTFGNLLKPLKLLPKLLKGFTAGLLGALMAMLPYLLIVGAVVVAIMGLMKILDHFGIGLDDIINGLISFKDFIFELPGKIADGFKSIFNKIQNFFIDAINGVIDLINKFKPGKDIEKLDRVSSPDASGVEAVEMTAPGAKDYDMTSATEAQDNAFDTGPKILSATEQQDNAFDVTPQEEGGGFFDKLKSFFKSKPANNEYMPVDTQTQSGGSAIIDNSVKTVNQSNTTQSTGLSSRNDDATIFRTSDIAV